MTKKNIEENEKNFVEHEPQFLGKEDDDQNLIIENTNDAQDSKEIAKDLEIRFKEYEQPKQTLNPDSETHYKSNGTISLNTSSLQPMVQLRKDLNGSPFTEGDADDEEVNTTPPKPRKSFLSGCFGFLFNKIYNCFGCLLLLISLAIFLLIIFINF